MLTQALINIYMREVGENEEVPAMRICRTRIGMRAGRAET